VEYYQQRCYGLGKVSLRDFVLAPYSWSGRRGVRLQGWPTVGRRDLQPLAGLGWQRLVIFPENRPFLCWAEPRRSWAVEILAEFWCLSLRTTIFTRYP
jgi:hypothetical protein